MRSRVGFTAARRAEEDDEFAIVDRQRQIGNNSTAPKLFLTPADLDASHKPYPPSVVYVIWYYERHVSGAVPASVWRVVL